MSKSSKSRSKVVKKSKSSSLPDWLTNRRLHCLLILLFSFLLYGNTLRHQYTQDDAIVIYDNMFTTKGIKGIPGILKYDTFYGFFKEEGKANLVAGGRYRPFTLMMYALEVQLFAPVKKEANGNTMLDKDGDVVYDPNQDGKLNAVKFVGHFMNVLLFGLTCIMLYLVMLEMLQSIPKKSMLYFLALGSTLLFLTHPTHTEVVANIKGRDEIVTLLGSLAALYFSLLAFRQTKIALNILAGVLFFIGLMAKENAITFLGVVPLAYWFFTPTFKTGGTGSRLKVGSKVKLKTIALQMIPFVVASVLFIGLRGAVLKQNQGSGQNIVNTVPNELMNNPYLKIENNQYVPFTTFEKLATITYTLGKYVQLLFVPHPLTHDYYPRHVDKMSWSDWQVLLSLLIHLALLGFGLWALMKKEPIGFGILFYLGTLFLVSNIIFPIGTNMAERFLFMPSVGFSFVMALLGYRLMEKLSNKPIWKSSLFAVGALSLLFSVKTVLRNNDWKDNYTLFMTDILVSQNSAKLRNSVGGELVETFKNNPNENIRKTRLTEAVGHLAEAIKIHPNYKNAYLIMGNAYNYLQQYENAVAAYQNALRIDPDYDQATKNMGITYRDAGKYYGEQKQDLAKAVSNLNEAYKILGDEDPEVIRLLGVAYGMAGQNDQAISFFLKLTQLQPSNATAFWNLANAYRFAGDTQKETEFRQKAKQIDPNVEKQFNQ